ncbi:Nucleolar protein 13 [Termitomyces sp. J132]|nr:Nucleolar protein 13 [Termitomyces sp. J132]
MSSSSSSSSRSSSLEPPVQQKRKREAVSAETVDDHDEASGAEPTPDDTVLSHADRRKQRKAEKRKAKEAEEGVTTTNTKKKRKLENGKSVSVPGPGPAAQRKNSVWVGNLSFKTTQEDLKAFFKDVGEIVRIYMPTKLGANNAMKPENRGFAYVDFATKDAKIVAITLSEQPLLGRKLLIKDGDDFAGRPVKEGADVAATNTHSKTARKILQSQKQPPAPTLFLGNLGFETTDEDIRHTKDVWLRKVRMGTFEDSGLCKGFAFVDFKTTEDATAALINPKNHRLNGRDLVVEYAGPDAVRRGAPKGSKREDGSAPPPSRKRETPLHSKRAERPERKTRHNQDETKIEEGPVEQEEEQGHHVHVNPEHRREVRKTFVGKERKEKGPRLRPKPGAALAQAKRESAAILPSQGNKITF